jgi:hypothetical protein
LTYIGGIIHNVHKRKTPIKEFRKEKNTERYLKRWEIERIFKTWKQEFDFEKIWTQDIQKTDNLVYLVQLCIWISSYIYNRSLA